MDAHNQGTISSSLQFQVCKKACDKIYNKGLKA